MRPSSGEKIALSSAKSRAVSLAPPSQIRVRSMILPEVHSNKGFDLHRLTVQQIRTVAPLPDGFERSLCQNRLPACHAQALNGSIFRDDGMEPDLALYAGQHRHSRVDGLNAMH